MITAETFAEYLGENDYEDSSRKADIDRAFLFAEASVSEALADAWRPVPEPVYDQCVLDVALAVYQRSSNSSGNYSAENPAGPLDPMQRAMPTIRKYVNRL